MDVTADGREKLLKSLRAQVTAAAPDHADAVLETLLEAMKATKRAWGTCTGCGQRVELQVQDAAAAVNAAKVLMEQAEGRPGIAGDAEDNTLIVQRVYVREHIQSLVPGWHDLAVEARGGSEKALAALEAELAAAYTVETLS